MKTSSLPLRGLFFIEFAESFTGGPQVLVNFLATVDRAAIDPIVVTNKPSRMTEELDEIGVPYRILPLPEGIQASKGAALTGSFKSKFQFIGRTLSYNKQIGQIIKEKQINFVWARNVKGTLLTGVAAKKARVPFFWDIGMEKFAEGLVTGLFFLAFALSTKVVAEAGVVFEQVFPGWMRRIFRKKLTVNLSGISEERIAAIERCREIDRDPDRIHVLNVASVNPRKNQAMLIEAVHLAKVPNLHLSIAGPTADADYLKKLTDYLQENAMENVEFLGWRDDIPELFGSADLFVICSKNEGVPYSVLEALNAGIPIVSTRAGGIPDVMITGETGTLIDVGDVEGLANCLRDFAARPEVYHALAASGKKYVRENHQLRDWCNRYVELIREACT